MVRLLLVYMVQVGDFVPVDFIPQQGVVAICVLGLFPLDRERSYTVVPALVGCPLNNVSHNRDIHWWVRSCNKQHMKGKTNILLYIGVLQNFAIKSEKH